MSVVLELGTDAQLASLDSDRRTGKVILVNDENHDGKGYKGAGVQRITDSENRDLGNTKGTGLQIAGKSWKL